MLEMAGTENPEDPCNDVVKVLSMGSASIEKNTKLNFGNMGSISLKKQSMMFESFNFETLKL